MGTANVAEPDGLISARKIYLLMTFGEYTILIPFVWLIRCLLNRLNAA